MKIVFVFVIATTLVAAVPHPQKGLLSDIEVLALTRGHNTTSRRVPAIPQLRCVGGPAAGEYEPEFVKCTQGWVKRPNPDCISFLNQWWSDVCSGLDPERANEGWAGSDYVWKCEAQMPQQYKLGTVNVSCEGHDYKNDSYVLHGSCGLEYTLEYNWNPPDVSVHPCHMNPESWFMIFYDLCGIGMTIVMMVQICLGFPSRVAIENSAQSAFGQDAAPHAASPATYIPPPHLCTFCAHCPFPGCLPSSRYSDSCSECRGGGGIVDALMLAILGTIGVGLMSRSRR